MKTIAVTATNKSLDAPVGPRFARERYVILGDPETLEWEAVDNLQQLALMEGVGVHLANFQARKKVTAALPGN